MRMLPLLKTTGKSMGTGSRERTAQTSALMMKALMTPVTMPKNPPPRMVRPELA